MVDDEYGKRLKRIRFGPAGKPIGFKGKTEEVLSYLRGIKLDALEVQQVRGINIKEEQAKKIGDEAKRNDIKLSIHAPYAINLCSNDREIREKSKERLLQALKIAEIMGATVVVFHPGYYKGMSKEEALESALRLIKEIEEEASSLGIRKAKLGAETTGKKSQLGSLDEVIEMSKSSDLIVPVIDFAHIHAREEPRLSDKRGYQNILDRLEKELGGKVKSLHIHFSKIEYSNKGERRHHIFGSGFGPRFVPLIELILERGIEATIISESPLLDQDALKMKKIAEMIAFKQFKSRKELEKLE